MEDGDPVRQDHRFRLVVRHVDEGDAGAALQRLELEAHTLAQLGVEIGQRFVEQQDRRLDHERTRKRDALLLSSAELPWMPVLEALEPDGGDNALDTRLVLAAIEIGVAQAEGDVFHDRHVRPYRIVLEHHPHTPPLRRHDAIRRREDLAGDGDLSAVRSKEAREKTQSRRLAAAGGAEKGDELLLRDGDIDLADRAYAVVALRQFLDFYVSHCRDLWITGPLPTARSNCGWRAS